MAGIPRIVIKQQFAQLGVNVTHARLNISPQKMKMRIKTETPKMEIDRQAPRFRVNRRKVNSESGLSSPAELSKAFRDAGRAAALRGARNAKNDGNFLGDMRRPGDRAGQLAAKKAMEEIYKNQYRLNIGLMPSSLPEVIWDEGYMHINWSKHSLVIDWDGDYMPQMTVDPKHSVEIYIRTEPYFRIMVENVLDPGRSGVYVDQAV